MNDNRFKYSYRQGQRDHVPFLRISDNNSSCLGSFVAALVVVLVATCMFFLVYFGWTVLVEPKWQILLAALGGMVVSKKSIYYTEYKHPYQLISGGTARIFMLTDIEFRQLLKPGAVRISNGIEWRLHPSERLTHEFFSTRTNSYSKSQNRR